jgi:mycothiol synthase
VELIRRPYADSDADALTAFMRAMAVAAGADPGLTVEVVRSWFAGSVVRDAAADTQLVFDHGHLAAAALLSPPADGGERVDIFGGVLPAWQGHGLGRELLAWSFERARQLRAELAPEGSWAVDADAYSTEPRAFRLFERFGMKPIRYWYEMAADLGRPVTADAPAGLRVVPFTEDLTGALYAAHNEAMADHFDFEPTGLSEWAQHDLLVPGFRPDLSRIGLAGPDVAAYVLVADETSGRVRMEEIGTRRAWRRRGAASSLLASAMTAAAADGRSTATLGVDSQSPTGAVSMYQRAGFKVVSSWVSYRTALG